MWDIFPFKEAREVKRERKMGLGSGGRKGIWTCNANLGPYRDI
jgi:hypothetical protein